MSTDEEGPPSRDSRRQFYLPWINPEANVLNRAQVGNFLYLAGTYVGDVVSIDRSATGVTVITRESPTRHYQSAPPLGSL